MEQPQSTGARAWGILDLTAAAMVAAAIAVMVGDQVANDAFIPEEYFSYFTIQTSLINIVLLAWGGWALLKQGAQSLRYAQLRAALVAYGAVTGIVYNALLRGIEPEPDVYISAITWPNEVVHVIIPLYLIIEWGFHRGRSQLPRSTIGIGLVYPLAWVAFTLLRGVIDGWFPYPFLDPETAGWGGTAAYVVGIALFITVLIALARVVNNRAERRVAG